MVSRWRMVITASEAGSALLQPTGRRSDTGWSSSSSPRSTDIPTNVEVTLF